MKKRYLSILTSICCLTTILTTSPAFATSSSGNGLLSSTSGQNGGGSGSATSHSKAPSVFQKTVVVLPDGTETGNAYYQNCGFQYWDKADNNGIPLTLTFEDSTESNWNPQSHTAEWSAYWRNPTTAEQGLAYLGFSLDSLPKGAEVKTIPVIKLGDQFYTFDEATKNSAPGPVRYVANSLDNKIRNNADSESREAGQKNTVNAYPGGGTPDKPSYEPKRSSQTSDLYMTEYYYDTKLVLTGIYGCDDGCTQRASGSAETLYKNGGLSGGHYHGKTLESFNPYRQTITGTWENITQTTAMHYHRQHIVTYDSDPEYDEEGNFIGYGEPYVVEDYYTEWEHTGTDYEYDSVPITSSKTITYDLVLPEIIQDKYQPYNLNTEQPDGTFGTEPLRMFVKNNQDVSEERLKMLDTNNPYLFQVDFEKMFGIPKLQQPNSAPGANSGRKPDARSFPNVQIDGNALQYNNETIAYTSIGPMNGKISENYLYAAKFMGKVTDTRQSTTMQANDGNEQKDMIYAVSPQTVINQKGNNTFRLRSIRPQEFNLTSDYVSNYWAVEYRQTKWFDYGWEYNGYVSSSSVFISDPETETSNFYVGSVTKTFEQPILKGDFIVKTVGGSLG